MGALVGVVVVVSIIALIYYLQSRHAVPRWPNEQNEALAFCARCVYRYFDVCIHPGSPVYLGECGPVYTGRMKCEVELDRSRW